MRAGRMDSTLENLEQPFRKKQLSMQATLPKTSRSVGTSLHAKGVTVNQLEVRAILEKSGIALIAQHLNMNTLEWKMLRLELQKAGFGAKVLQNRKAGKLLEGTRFQNLSETLKGPVCMIHSLEGSSQDLKGLLKTLDSNPKMVLVGGIVDSTLASVGGIQTISQLPAKEELLGGMVFGLESIWRDQLVGSLDSVPKRLTSTLTASQEEMVNSLSRLDSNEGGLEK